MPGGGPQSADAREETPGMKVLCAIDGSRHSQWALAHIIHDRWSEGTWKPFWMRGQLLCPLAR